MPKRTLKKGKRAKSSKHSRLSFKAILRNKNLLLLAAVALLILLTIPVILHKTESTTNLNNLAVSPTLTPSAESNTSPTTTQTPKYALKSAPSATPTHSPTPTPKGVMTVRGHFVDENMQPFTHPGLNVRVLNERTKKEKQTSDQPHWVFKLQTPADLIFTAPSISGYTGYVTLATCFGENACLPVIEKKTSCIESECNSNPDSWKARFRYAGYNNDNVLYVVLHPEQTAEIYFMYKKY